MSVIGGLQAAQMEFSRQTKFAEHQQGEIVMMAYSGGALADSLTITQSWTRSDRTHEGDRLPPEVLYELRIAEDQLTAAQGLSVTAVRHSSVIYQIIRPTPLPPTGLLRFWRFWLSPQESE